LKSRRSSAQSTGAALSLELKASGYGDPYHVSSPGQKVDLAVLDNLPAEQRRFQPSCYHPPVADDVLAPPRSGAATAGYPTVRPDPQPLKATITQLECPVEPLPLCIRAAVEDVGGFA
jgi:hypothetical protein